MSRTALGKSWREPVLAHFTPEIAAASRLTIVADPDELLAEQGVLDGIRQRGFELIPFDDHVAFRYAFESRYRQVWDRGEETTLVVVLRASRSDVDDLPYDLLEQAKRHSRLLSFSIGELFPHLDPHVVSRLDRADLEALYQAQTTHNPGPLGENATKDFILRHVFEVAPELIKSPADLLRVLLRHHYSSRVFPAPLDERFIQILRQIGGWDNWPLSEIVPDRLAFLTFLEERWPLFLQREISGGTSRAEPLRYHGPKDLPFEHDDIRVYIDNLFVEGYLAPTDSVSKSAVAGTWMALGVIGDPEEDKVERLGRLLQRIASEFPDPEALHTAWIMTAVRWAEATALRWRLAGSAQETVENEFTELHERLEDAFAAWMLVHYASLHNLAFWPRPVMLHHVPRFLAHDFTPQSGTKHALVVIDGLAFDQWIVLREDLEAKGHFDTEEGGVFAWVPTLTAVSRQSIFAGEPPFFFASSIRTTLKEEQHWQRFWEDHGALRNQIGYVRQKKHEDEEVFLERVLAAAEHPKCRTLGVVVGTVDQAMHGGVMGTGGMHASVRHWAEVGRFRKLATLLVENGFDVFVTADHGNIETQGMGKPNVGEIADERGERVHVFRDDLTREKVRKDYEGTLVWPQIGLPEEYRPLLAPGRRAFINRATTAVAHGGISVEEVIVPFVRVKERR